MARGTIPPGDDQNIRCPRLGHQISFSYCLSENRDLPCFKILDCWYNHFQVEEFLKDKLTSEQWVKIFGSPPKPKLISLVELIEQAKKRNRERL
ncbi:MAG: hypothetical protein JRJ15_10425 [Deltaproteobacteria bacterium]|nr:hypothetical protein [Deltaproteobacteria bacterium]